jgi:hypothetical protein
MSNLLRSYVFWTYERGSFHYDVMVTLILIFMFVSPRLIDFKDRPVETVAINSSEVLVKGADTTDGSSRFIYQIRADQPGGPQEGQSDDQRRTAMLRVIEPISGAVTVERYEPVLDSHSKVVAYNVWAVR